MRKLLVCQHVAHELLGTLNPLCKSFGFRIRYVNFGRHPDAQPSLGGHHGLILLGGPMNANQIDQYPHLTTELGLIEQALDKKIPVLGICLGAQLIARVLGAKVTPNHEEEIGWYNILPTEEGRRDPLLAHFRNVERIFQCHGDTFEIPNGTVHLAVSPTCSNQAFRLRTNVYGFQFHLEVDEPMINRWFKNPVHRKQIEMSRGKFDPQTIMRQTPLYIERLRWLSNRTFGEFIKLFGIEKKRKRLTSR
ncbi:MAG: gamma-glutamyl-gamma-aminobutyrate hydrolase family protein [Candidatus Binatia bacterium]